MSTRREAREALVRLLYLAESRGITIDEAFAEMSAIDSQQQLTADDEERESLEPFSLGIDDEQREFVHSLAKKIEENREFLNKIIVPLLKNWDLSRIPRIDRIILWIALAEMNFMFDVPRAVSINEAVELANDFSSEKSASFINGILDAASKR